MAHHMFHQDPMVSKQLSQLKNNYFKAFSYFGISGEIIDCQGETGDLPRLKFYYFHIEFSCCVVGFKSR
jgi:hypothetical protein